MSASLIGADSQGGNSMYLWFYAAVTALIMVASYRNQEFIRVGYYVYNELTK